MWALAVGENLPALERRAAQGLPTPAIDNRPQLYDDVVEIWNAFLELSVSRPCGFGPGAIPFTEIEAWLRLHDVTGCQERHDYAYLIRALDQTWLTWQGERDPNRKT